MAHSVLCPYCRQKFDRDTQPYVLYGKRRYAHAECALRIAAEDPTKPKPEIIDPTEIVFCIYCKEQMNRKDEDCIMLSEGRFAHKKCEELEQKRDLTDEEKLYKYIKEKFNSDFIPPMIMKQIKSYIKQYNYTYSQMLKVLIYGIDISKKMTLDLGRPTIGLLPYLYQEAYNYYYALWLAEQANKDKQLKKPEVEEIKITSPKRQEMIKKHFTFLLEDEISDL